ncbi:hypothetical protein DFH07DRAFT_764319 [Mycena maculata]|uniref:Uncharacterized protein n=1 Tax=Mycena maculata TaxID=230809 RepID=A0AAD7P1F9_9AGAR|nr:hypothetical protein DFH07DRAFT_764319 [Mycena maculata]
MAPDDGKKPCAHCGGRFLKGRGLKNHEGKCSSRKASKDKDTEFTTQLKAQRRQAAYAELDAQLRGPLGQTSAEQSHQPDRIPAKNATPDYLGEESPEDHEVEMGFDPDKSGQRAPSPPPAEDIKRVFHPHSKREPTFQSFNEYLVSNIAERPFPTDSQPWRPFRSQLDFEVAEFCEHNMLNKDATETLIKLIRRCAFSPDDFTLANHAELDELWELASHKCTPFERGTVTIQYKGEDKVFDTYTRPLWDWTFWDGATDSQFSFRGQTVWEMVYRGDSGKILRKRFWAPDQALSLVQDKCLVSCFVWDAEKAYKFNGDTYMRFYHEPWTANAFWAAQSALPDDPAAKPVCYVIYADKSKLSSFGTQKAYAVVARLANIPIAIRNSDRFGGGQVVGHQPIVKDDPQENNKPAFSNFKNIVWHTALYKLLESLVPPSKTGYWTTCGDEIARWLWPIILILAADYEEACVQNSDLSAEHPLRTGSESQQIVEQARELRTAADREEHLKDHGLRDVDNVFWKVGNADPHKAISYDPLHADDGGFWGDHLFAQIKARVTELGRSAIVKIDTQMAAFPRWSGLNHFETVMNTSFNDGSKHEDIAKMMLFVAHNVLVDEASLLLLQALRSYLEGRTLISLEIHTSESIAAGRRELQTLDSRYIVACKGTVHEEKNWNFPKFHARRHVFDDIENKGASRNFGTKTSESMHGPIRQTYHRLTNFKDVTPQARLLRLDSLSVLIPLQLAKHDHRRTVSTFIREQIDALNEPEDSPADLEASILSNVDIGSRLKDVSFSEMERASAQDPAFERFRVKFGDFISDFLPTYGYTLPNGKRLRFEGTDTITPFQFLKVHYESMSTWTSTADYLRCNPKFHGHPRYDCVLIETPQQPIFAQIISLFSCVVEGKSHPFALVQPLDAPTGPLKRKDKLLRFHRVRTKPRKSSEFISVHSIIRGAVLVPDFDKEGEFIVFDVLDTDAFLRYKSLYPRRS